MIMIRPCRLEDDKYGYKFVSLINKNKPYLCLSAS